MGMPHPPPHPPAHTWQPPAIMQLQHVATQRRHLLPRNINECVRLGKPAAAAVDGMGSVLQGMQLWGLHDILQWDLKRHAVLVLFREPQAACCPCPLPQPQLTMAATPMHTLHALHAHTPTGFMSRSLCCQVLALLLVLHALQAYHRHISANRHHHVSVVHRPTAAVGAGESDEVLVPELVYPLLCV
jgi:hypothetical protein